MEKCDGPSLCGVVVYRTLHSGTKRFMAACSCTVLVQNAVLVDANSYANVEDTDFIDNVGTGDQSLLQSTNSGALLELRRVIIEGNTGGRVRNSGTCAFNCRCAIVKDPVF
jgi:hypothetical protein